MTLFLLSEVLLLALPFVPGAGETCAQDGVASPGGPSGRSVKALAVERAGAHIRYGYDLAQRRAFYSAQQEFSQALRVIAKALDAETASHEHELALAEGLQAIQEVDRTAQGERQETIVVQQRLAFAQERLASSLEHETVASQALYALARLEIAIAEETRTQKSLAVPKAMAFYQVAIVVAPANSLAANELAVLFARYGQFEDAERILMHGLSKSAMPEMWYNLSVVYQRMGQRDLAQQARTRYEALAAACRNTNQSPDASQPGSIASLIHWTEPVEFSQSRGSVWNDGPSPKPGQSSTAQATTSAPPTPKKERVTLLPEWIVKGVKNLSIK